MVYERFQQYLQGLITKQEFIQYCESNQIHGALETESNKIRFVGHDYKNQTWIRFN